MALPAGTVFEVRPGVGSDTTAGGGFVAGSSGTDYSQQNSAQYNATDLASVSSLVVSSASHNFVAADVGNLIHITAGSGFTAGYYQIVSVSANQATLDRSPGTAGVGGTYYVGGAMATVSNALANCTPNNTIWVKATGTYTVSAVQNISIDSHTAPGNPLAIIGYTSTRGDNGQFTWTTATNSIDLIDFSVASATANFLLQNISFTTTASSKANCLEAKNASTNTVNLAVINCEINGFVIGIEGNFAVDTSFIGLQLVNSRVTGCSSHGVRNGVCHTYVIGCMIDNNGGDGFNTGTTDAVSGVPGCYFFEKSIFYKNAGNGINIAFGDASSVRLELIILSHCDCSTNTGAGLLFAQNSTCPLGQISNSIFDANGTYGIDAVSGSIVQSCLLYSNAFYNNTTAATRNTNAGFNTVTLSANPYTSIGTDFSLNSTAGGGAACKGAGWPGVLNAGGTGHADIGALQSSGAVTTTVNVIAPTQNRILTYEGE
jgi:hypothetical protein